MPRDGELEIGYVETRGRRKRANGNPTSIISAPASEPTSRLIKNARTTAHRLYEAGFMDEETLREFDLPEKGVSRKRAETVAAPNLRPPASESIAGGSEGEGQQRPDTQEYSALAEPINEIGSSETKVRRKRAIRPPTPTDMSPASESIASDGEGEGHHVTGTQHVSALAESTNEIGHVETRGRRKRATSKPTPGVRAPASESIAGDSDGESPFSCDTQRKNALAEIIKLLTGCQKRRVFAITQKSRSDRAIESLIAGVIGFRVDADAKARKEVFAQAKAFRLAVEKSDEKALLNNSLITYIPTILTSSDTRKNWDELQDKAEKDMAELAKLLPVYEFVKSVKGFGLVGLAAICAEAGIPIGEYRTVSGLWKRMGLAVIGGERQQRKRGKEDAEAHGYSPKRRSQVWQFFSDSMFRHQWVADKDEDGKDPKKSGKDVAVPAHPGGPYGEVYGRRMQHTLVRVEATEDLEFGDPNKWTFGRRHNDARRIMSKAVLRDLWRVWNGLPPRGFAPPDEFCRVE